MRPGRYGDPEPKLGLVTSSCIVSFTDEMGRNLMLALPVVESREKLRGKRRNAFNRAGYDD